MGKFCNGFSRAATCQSVANAQNPRNEGEKLNLLAALKECSVSRNLKRGEALHHRAASSGLLGNTSIANSLITMYGKCGSVSQARTTFEQMQNRNSVSWTALLQAYVENGQPEIALELFENMERAPQSPSARTYLVALSACTSLASTSQKGGSSSEKWFVRGRMIHSKALASRCCDVFVENRLIDMYGKCGRMVEARGVFDGMVARTAVSWTSLLHGYVENGESELAVDMFQGMDCAPDARTYVAAISACASSAAKQSRRDVVSWLEKGKMIHSRAVADGSCDIYVESSLVDMYAKCGCMALARSVFERMKRRNVVSWTALIMGYVEHGENETALELLSRMQTDGVACNARTYVAGLMACGNLMAIETGKALYTEIINRGLEKEVLVANSLVDFFAKCGSMSSAKQVFDTISRKTTVSWTALMCGYGLVGESQRVLEVFELMREQGVAPDEVTFVCLLSACSHSGETKRGQQYLEAMVREYGIQPRLKHYVCVVDMMGRANCLEEAVRIVRGMPVEPDVLVWKAILGACRKWGDAAAAKVAYEALMKTDEGESAAYVMLGNTYKSFAATGGGQTLWTDEADGKVHKFRELL